MRVIIHYAQRLTQFLQLGLSVIDVHQPQPDCVWHVSLVFCSKQSSRVALPHSKAPGGRWDAVGQVRHLEGTALDAHQLQAHLSPGTGAPRRHVFCGT